MSALTVVAPTDFAGWVVFYIDQYAELRDAWRRSLDERAASLRAD